MGTVIPVLRDQLESKEAARKGRPSIAPRQPKRCQSHYARVKARSQDVRLGVTLACHCCCPTGPCLNRPPAVQCSRPKCAVLPYTGRYSPKSGGISQRRAPLIQVRRLVRQPLHWNQRLLKMRPTQLPRLHQHPIHHPRQAPFLAERIQRGNGQDRGLKRWSCRSAAGDLCDAIRKNQTRKFKA